ncbi:MAG: ABC transporter substrate-binding protein [Chloroflexota bacterium]|nr:MAG: ABC transporter substrate-binding protein [Chloroflexota bacterium]
MYAKQSNHRFLIPVLIIFLAFLLQACSGSTTTPTEQSSTQDRQGQLRVAIQPIVQTDPAFISSDPEIIIASSIYDYLVDVTPQNTIAPRLAREWTVSEDGKIYVFSLVNNATFHDDTLFTAEDVVWTFNRLRDPEVDSPTKDLYSNIESIEASDRFEVTFTLKEPNPFFLYDLSDNHALILKADTEDPGSDFIGTGPFKLVSYNPEDRLVVEANEDYFLSDRPKLEGVEFIFFNDQVAQAEALRSEQVDLVMLLSSDLFNTLVGEQGIIPLEAKTNSFDVVRLRADRPTGDDPRLMQALRLATDRQAIFDLVLQGNGAIGKDTPVGPMYSQYYGGDLQPPDRDIEAARQLLADAGYPEGISFELHTPDTGNRPNLAVVLKDQWSEAGIDVDVIVEPESVYYGEDGWLAVDLGITGWGSRPYPQFYLDTMLVCDAIWNESHFCDPEFDSLAGITGTTMNEDERVEAYRQIQELLIERGPILIPYFFSQLGAINEEFTDFQMKPFPGRSDLSTVRLAKQ